MAESTKPYRVLHPVRYEGELKTSGTVMLPEEDAAPALARGIVEKIGVSAVQSSETEDSPSDLDAEMVRLFGEDLAKDLYKGDYKSIEQVRSASEEELLALNGIGKKRYEQIRRASDNPNATV